MTDPASGGLGARALVYLKRTRKCSYLCIFVNCLFLICIFVYIKQKICSVRVTETRMSQVRQSQGMLRTSRGADLIGSESKRSKSVLIQTCIQYHSIQSNNNDITSLFRPEVCRGM